MTKHIIDDGILTSLANKIREKLGITDKMVPSAMPGKIGEIPAGEGVYAWKKSDSSGNFVEYVLDDDESAYPENGAGSDGYVYEKVKKIVILTPDSQPGAYTADGTFTSWDDLTTNGTVTMLTSNAVDTVSSEFSGALVVPRSVTVLLTNSVKDCVGLTELIIPSTFVGSQYDHSVCMGCTGLKKVTFEDGCAATLGDSFFSGCTSLKEVVLTGGLTFCNGIFSGCTSLESIILPEGITATGDSLFRGCSNLKSLYLPVSLTNIGFALCYNCTNLSDIYYAGTQAQWNAITKGTLNDNLSSVTMHYSYTY